jgi:hypothetical protein
MKSKSPAETATSAAVTPPPAAAPSAAAPTPAAAAPADTTPAPTAADTDPDHVPVSADYEEQAQKDVTASNVTSKLDDLDKEINK